MVSKPNLGGRPSTYTPELGAKICEMMRLGFSEQSAAEYVGIPRTTVTSWKETVDGFEQAVEQARGGGKRFVASQLMKLVLSGNVAATIFWLKTRCQEFREQKAPEQQSAADFARAMREYTIQCRSLDGLDPPEEDGEGGSEG
jgi:hypothetical protein